MNIIFGTEMAKQSQERYTVLELDTFNLMPGNEIVTAYCLVENIPVLEIPSIVSHKELHANLLLEYKKRNWEYCENTIEYLTGKWGGEADTFYSELHQRIQQLKEQNLNAEWNGIIEKTAQ